jgi:hypothetical protein
MMYEEVPLSELERKELEEKEERLKQSRTRASRKWQRKNKERIAARRKERYKKDPEFRRKQREYQRRYYKKKYAKDKAEREERRRQDRLGGRPNIRVKKPKMHIVVLPGGREVEVEMVSLSHLAKALGRQQATIRLWEKDGLLPEALYRNERGHRLYTLLQVSLIMDAIAEVKLAYGVKSLKYGIKKTNLAELFQKIWDDYPYGIDLNKGE